MHSFKHSDLIHDKNTRWLFREAVGLATLNNTAANPAMAHIEHDHDDACCVREPWPQTFVRILNDGPVKAREVHVIDVHDD